MEKAKDLKKILVSEGYLDDKTAKESLKSSVAEKSKYEDYLLAHKIITPDLLGQALAEYYKIPYADLNSKTPSEEMVKTIPASLAKKYRMVLFNKGEGFATITTDQPKELKLALSEEPQKIEEGDTETVRVEVLSEKLSKVFPKQKIDLSFSITKDIDDLLLSYRQTLQTRFEKIMTKGGVVATEILEEIINDAVTFNASDIHFDVKDSEVSVRFRIDGVLHEAGHLDKDNYETLLNRMKVKAQLRIDEHFKPQDGAIRFKTVDGDLDLRISVVPTMNGEKLAVRLLSAYIKNYQLEDLGLDAETRSVIEKQLTEPYGMFLVTGPTGSGKTTTLYSALKVLNQPGVNITTIEDPVEYRIDGVNQIQVNREVDLTFDRGLRSILRQDPDIVLVGEIRDTETADIAVNAALTGHLLFSTFHANDAATSIPRLLDMGIEPFLLASTLNVVVAQRLVRKLCVECMFSQTVRRSSLEDRIPNAKRFFESEEVRLYDAKGCSSCNGIGFKGRTAVFEILLVTPEMEEMIVSNPSSKELNDLAYKQGMKSMFETGISKVLGGLTTIEELMRVVPVPEDHENK